jgi:predicted RNase H-like nuclease (RuvC/YqgF family)
MAEIAKEEYREIPANTEEVLNLMEKVRQARNKIKSLEQELATANEFLSKTDTDDEQYADSKREEIGDLTNKLKQAKQEYDLATNLYDRVYEIINGALPN